MKHPRKRGTRQVERQHGKSRLRALEPSSRERTGQPGGPKQRHWLKCPEQVLNQNRRKD